MKKFEYDSEDMYTLQNNPLDELKYLKEKGNQGWELVTIVDGIRYYWKREIQQPK